jgi:hypothetical protein
MPLAVWQKYPPQRRKDLVNSENKVTESVDALVDEICGGTGIALTSQWKHGLCPTIHSQAICRGTTEPNLHILST